MSEVEKLDRNGVLTCKKCNATIGQFYHPRLDKFVATCATCNMSEHIDVDGKYKEFDVKHDNGV